MYIHTHTNWSVSDCLLMTNVYTDNSLGRTWTQIVTHVYNTRIRTYVCTCNMYLRTYVCVYVRTSVCSIKSVYCTCIFAYTVSLYCSE